MPLAAGAVCDCPPEWSVPSFILSALTVRHGVAYDAGRAFGRDCWLFWGWNAGDVSSDLRAFIKVYLADHLCILSDSIPVSGLFQNRQKFWRSRPSVLDLVAASNAIITYEPYSTQAHIASRDTIAI